MPDTKKKLIIIIGFILTLGGLFLYANSVLDPKDMDTVKEGFFIYMWIGLILSGFGIILFLLGFISWMGSALIYKDTNKEQSETKIKDTRKKIIYKIMSFSIKKTFPHKIPRRIFLLILSLNIFYIVLMCLINQISIEGFHDGLYIISIIGTVFNFMALFLLLLYPRGLAGFVDVPPSNHSLKIAKKEFLFTYNRYLEIIPIEKRIAKSKKRLKLFSILSTVFIFLIALMIILSYLESNQITEYLFTIFLIPAIFIAFILIYLIHISGFGQKGIDEEQKIKKDKQKEFLKYFKRIGLNVDIQEGSSMWDPGIGNIDNPGQITQEKKDAINFFKNAYLLLYRYEYTRYYILYLLAPIVQICFTYYFFISEDLIVIIVGIIIFIVFIFFIGLILYKVVFSVKISNKIRIACASHIASAKEIKEALDKFF
ncbi:MAG: hypothetical protein KGD63_03640 [Candidatus Lokiarchaeota archaeon]|nr:hypothetical protein [Candidatus Lokiarchaeota archaeon]